MRELLADPPTLHIIAGSSERVPATEVLPRQNAIGKIGAHILQILKESDVPIAYDGWQVSALGRQKDRLTGWRRLNGSITDVEGYETQIGEERRRHIRLYGSLVADAQRPYVPTVILADPEVADNLQQREPSLQFNPLTDAIRLHEETVPADVLQELGVLDAFGDTDNSQLLWAARKSSFQLIAVICINTGDQLMRIHVCEDKVYNSGMSLLVWSADGKPLGVDSVGKAIWGINITNSSRHRPEGKWIPL